MTNILDIEGLVLKIEDRTLFHDLSLHLPKRGLTALMGPAATGKSSLLTWICCGDAFPLSGLAKNAVYDDAPLDVSNRPSLVGQFAASTGVETLDLIEALFRDVAPSLLCIDEPTANLSKGEARDVMRCLADVAEYHSVLMVSHNQAQVADYADSVVLVAGAELQEHTPTSVFFTSPSSEAGHQFVGTGGVSVVRPDTPQWLLAPEQRVTPDHINVDVEVATSDDAPLWVMSDRLGLFFVEGDGLAEGNIATLKDNGVTAVVALDQDTPPDLAGLTDAGIVPVWVPLPDGQRSAASDHLPLCLECQRLLDDGETVVVLGTGDNQNAACVLASQLVYSGLSAEKAADMAAKMLGKQPLDLQNEQVIWELETHLDLAREGIAAPLRRRGRRHGRERGVARGSIATFRANGEMQAP
ncbi:MAG: ABC transporter ATP-binding protein [Pseudomonadota bacterium]